MPALKGRGHRGGGIGLAALLPLLLRAAPVTAEAPAAARNLVLITVDGLRWQELFSGVDPGLLAVPEKAGIEDLESVRREYWRETPVARRAALLPFFWGEFAPRGVVLGNRDRGSAVDIENPQRVSYPGYAELLTGGVQPAITGNLDVRSPRTTVLETLRRELALERRAVAVFASWDKFRFISAREEDAILTNAGYRSLRASIPDLPAEFDLLDRLQSRLLTPWDTVRHDAITAGLALRYLEAYAPRVLYLALGETDDWAHDRRYDRVLAAARFFDETLAALWRFASAHERYRERTAFVITTDHGRGRTPADWTDHGDAVAGAEEIWLAVVSPLTPARGELADTERVFLRDVAPTVLRLLGIDPARLDAKGSPVAAVLPK